MELDEVDDDNEEGEDKEEAPYNHAEAVEGAMVGMLRRFEIIVHGGCQAESEAAEEQCAETSHWKWSGEGAKLSERDWHDATGAWNLSS